MSTLFDKHFVLFHQNSEQLQWIIISPILQKRKQAHKVIMTYQVRSTCWWINGPWTQMKAVWLQGSWFGHHSMQFPCHAPIIITFLLFLSHCLLRPYPSLFSDLEPFLKMDSCLHITELLGNLLKLHIPGSYPGSAESEIAGMRI